MKNEIRVWRCPENAEVVRALENLQNLAAGIKDMENEQIEVTEAEYGKAGSVQTIAKKGETRNVG